MSTLLDPPAPPAAGESAGDEDVFVFPVSFAQQRLWFLDRLEPNNVVYNMPAALRLDGPLDAPALRRALDEVVRRHESLRTIFRVADGEPVQVVLPPRGVPMEEHDLRALPEAEAEAAARRIVDAEARRPFDLANGPLFRATLVRQPGERHVLVMSMHHIVSDGWSVGVLNGEISTLYRTFSEGRESPLPELPIQYADYAVWQREHLSGAELERQLAYWTTKLAGSPPVLELPTDLPRPPVQRYVGKTVWFNLPPELAQGLQALSRREGATLFMTMLAAFHLLMSRWSGQGEVVVGSPMAGRGRGEVEGLIGFFVNTLVLRGDLRGDPTFRELLARVKDDTLGAYAHQDVPFEKLVELLKVERSLAHSPIFQVMFNLQNLPAAAEGPALSGVKISYMEAENDTEKYDMTFTLTEHPRGIAGSVRFCSDLFEEPTILRMVEQYGLLLEQVAADASKPVSRYALLRPEQRAEVRETLNDTARPYPAGALLHELFEAHAAARPDHPAVVHETGTVTYGALNARANRLAHHLRALGVGPESRVGIYHERTPDLVAALYGVLKAGGAYVPLDPAYPRERIAYMVRNAGARVVVTQRHLAGDLPADDVTVVAWEDVEDALAALPADDPARAADEANLAYVIYTSGSTGWPKGVQIEHRTAVTCVRWFLETLEAEDRAMMLASTSINFDVHVAEIHVALAGGTTMRLVENALSLADVGEEAGLRLASMVPSAAAELLRMNGIPSTLRTLNLGGEALPNDLAQALYALTSVERVGNGYGPTEDTTYSTYCVVPQGAAKVTVGRPIANSRAYVLDGRMELVPVGVPGELFMAGGGVTRGYMGDARMTAERYVPDPHSGVPGARMYRVGDRVRWLPTGELEYFGRMDTQVKLRGYRIELGEIETVLRRHPLVQDAVVVIREDEPNDRRLVGYVVPAPGAEAPAVAELRGWVQQSLPDYMTPSAWVVLEALPMTPNGKVDRRALPAPEALRPELQEAFVEAGNPTEEALAAIWREVLGLDRVGMNDNFFDLGGHSLLLTQVQTKVKETLAPEITMVTLFRFPTIRALAEHLAGEASGEQESVAEKGQQRAAERAALRSRRRDRR